ncbi:pepsin/retropepsin-like aspartic protease family protein [Parasphingorhabdus litoris]|nr:hypothetical protein [Parasphingorhabdus litoris]
MVKNSSGFSHTYGCKFSHMISFLCFSALVSGSVNAAEEQGNKYPRSQMNYIELPLQRGGLSGNGAAPWFTDALSIGESKMDVVLDNGSHFNWATSDRCTTPACNAHKKVNTAAGNIAWIDESPMDISWGPWGTMAVGVGKGTYNLADGNGSYLSYDQNLTLSLNYSGPKFEYLPWGAGITLPSDSRCVWSVPANPICPTFDGTVEKPKGSKISSGLSSSFLLYDLYFNADKLQYPQYSLFTDRPTRSGSFYMGGDNYEVFDKSTAVNLPPRSTPLGYLWGTKLHEMKVGSTSLGAFESATIVLDTGSSRFKGDAAHIIPILNQLLKVRDSNGMPVFERTFEGTPQKWTSLKYRKGGPKDHPNLPPISIEIGQSCKGVDGQHLVLTLAPDQYSYRIEEGDQRGTWAVSVHVLDGLPFLLVGSTVLDLVYSRYSYNVLQTKDKPELIQGDMTVFRKATGEQPAGYSCVKPASA